MYASIVNGVGIVRDMKGEAVGVQWKETETRNDNGDVGNGDEETMLMVHGTAEGQIKE